MLVTVLVCALIGIARAQVGPQVNTTQGVIVGTQVPNTNYIEFFGIHYAGSTSGVNRFKAPPPAPAYPGPFQAVESSVICAQPTSRGLIGEEDCLRLNVFTNNVTTPKPVFVWLNGEEYTNTDNVLQTFRRLVDAGLVVVQINYRLSVFGFLCLGVPDAPGNAGLKDVVQGLKWIRENIAGFGGNPNNVVLFGHGSGAAMADLITMSPLSQNLVHKVIAQSGSALAPWAIAYDPIGHAQILGDKLGYSGNDKEKLARHLVETDINVLGSALNGFDFSNNTALFAPCIEDVNLNPNDTFLADTPINLLRSGNYSHIPYIAGYTNREGTLRAEQAIYRQWLERMQGNFTEFLPVDLTFDLNTNRTAVETTIREFYFSQRVINMETIEDYLDYQGDTLVLVSVIRGVRERASTSRAEVRLMEFAYRGTLNSDWTYQQIPLTGVKHGGVLNYLLGTDLMPADEPVATSLVSRIANFANTGVPTGVPNSATWLAVNNNTINYLYYGGGDGSPSTNTRFVEENRNNPHTQRMTLWNDIYSRYYRPPRPVSSAHALYSITLVVLSSQLFVRMF